MGNRLAFSATCMTLESWLLRATPEVVGLLPPLDLLDLSDKRGGGPRTTPTCVSEAQPRLFGKNTRLPGTPRRSFPPSCAKPPSILNW